MKLEDSPRCLRTKAGRIDELERKLAMCRETLENIQSNCENDAPSDPDCERSVSLAWILDTAAETLEATAP